jgi:hypothetical protein
MRGGARVTRGLLPSRPVLGQDSLRVERARLAATAAVALPLAVLAFTVWQALRVGPTAPVSGATVSGAAPGAPPLAGPTVAARDDPAARIVRLDGVAGLAALPGAAGDDRTVAVAGGVPYVLNRSLDRIDRWADGAMGLALARGQVVGEDSVGELEDLFTVPGASGGERVLALDAAGRVWQLAPGALRRLGLAGQPQWQAVTRATGYAGNLYVLDRGAGQVWRYSPAGGDAYNAPGIGWLVDPETMPNAVDLAIDGAVYVLGADATVTKLVDGSPVPFRLAEVPQGLLRARSLVASATGQGLLVPDPVNLRLLRFGADGTFLHQLLFPPQAGGADEAVRAGRLRDLADAAWDEPGGNLYIAAGPWLYRAPYRGG